MEGKSFLVWVWTYLQSFPPAAPSLIERGLTVLEMISEQEIERRKPVWSALSDLYLDTELPDDTIERIVQTFINSRYSLAEIKQINYNEVAPVVGRNLISIAGEWAGFDEEWLSRAITEQLHKKKPTLNFQWIRNWYIDRMTTTYWNKIEMEWKKNNVT